MIPAAIHAEYKETVSAAVQGEAFVSHVVGDASQVTGPDPSLGLRLLPTLSYSLAGHGSVVGVSYYPVVSVRDAFTAPTPLLVHQATIQSSWTTRSFRFGVQEIASYGETNPADLAGPSPGQVASSAPLQKLPTASTLRSASSSTLGSMTYSASRIWSIGGRVGYSVGGGLDEASRQALPVRAGPEVTATSGYALTRRDHLITEAGFVSQDSLGLACASATTTTPVIAYDCSAHNRIAHVDQSWIHNWTPKIATTLLAGVSTVIARVRLDTDYSANEYPDAGFLLDAAAPILHGQIIFRGGGHVGPVVDLTSGVVNQRIEGSASFDMRWTKTQVAGGFQAARALANADAPSATLMQSQFGVVHQLTKHFLATAGIRLAWQDSGSTLLSTVTYIGLAFDRPDLRF